MDEITPHTPTYEGTADYVVGGRDNPAKKPAHFQEVLENMQCVSLIQGYTAIANALAHCVLARASALSACDGTIVAYPGSYG